MNIRRQKQIEEIASELLRRTGYYPANFSALINNEGIDVAAVARKIGVDLKEHDFGEEISGVLLRNGDKAQIGYAKSNWETRQRFTIAHELGHYSLNHQRQGVFVDTPEKYFALFRNSRSSTGEDVQEREANAFAAALLMPMGLVREGISCFLTLEKAEKEGFQIVPDLAKRFHVSELAMTYRLTNLNSVW